MSVFGPRLHADQRPQPLHFVAIEAELEAPGFVILMSVALGVPRAAIPQHYGAAAVLAFGDHTFKTAISQRVIFHLYGEPLYRRIDTGPFCDRPTFQHAV